MTRTWIGFAAALSLLAACRAAAPRPEEQAAPPPAAGESAAAPAGDAWEELLHQLKQTENLVGQQKSAQADEYYRVAERYYQAGDFEKAEAEVQKALQVDADHAPARALYLEIQFLLGRGKPTPASEEYDRYRQQAVVRQQQVLIEIDGAFARGTRSYNLGDYDAAEREFRTILEYAKWMPTGVELESRRKQALDMIERTKGAHRQKKLDDEKARLRMIEEEKERDNLRRMLGQKRELEILFGQAQVHFEREEYARCQEICDRILYINPNVTSVAEMRNVAQRLMHSTRGRENLQNLTEEWKRTFENIEMVGITQADELAFADRETWIEEISKRKPKGIAELEEEVNEEDRSIKEKLKSLKIDLAHENAPLTGVIDFLREFSGLNIVIDAKNVEAPQDKNITIRVTNIPLDSALNLILGQHQLVYLVEGGVIKITSADQIKKNVKLELYDVQDLTFGRQDFPGVDIALSQDAIGAAIIAGEPEVKAFTGEDLADLIKKTIYKDQWDEADGKSIQFQNGLLIVRNMIDVHKAIRKFLSDLRASTSMVVSVEARFLSVEDDFLQQVGMDFRDLNGARVQGITTLNDVNPAFIMNNQRFFVDPDGAGAGNPLEADSAGITGVFGDSVARSMGARVQHIMSNDFLVNRFFLQALRPLGGMSMQYTLLDDISLEAILKLVSRSERNHELTAPRLTLFNTQRGNFRVSNQVAYIKDWDIQAATGAVSLDPIVDVVSDGISLDVRPVVSADRKYVTLELRPTVATLFPAPNAIPTVTTFVGAPGSPITDMAAIIIDTPIVRISRIRTTVVVPDRGTLLLGGMTELFEESADSGIPLWSSVPILGNIGSSKIKGLQRKQILIVLRVRVIIPDEEERRLF